MKQKRGRESGQVGMTVLLVMVIMITVAVALAQRSVSNLNLSRREQESTRSLDLAESGLDQILNSNSYVSGETYKAMVANKEVYVSVNDLTEIQALPVSVGHTLEVDLGGVTTELSVIWPNVDCVAYLNNAAAIEVTLIKGSGSSYYAHRLAYDKCASRASINGFAPLSSINTTGYLLARIKVLYASTELSVVGVGLPKQGIRGKSSASDTSETTTALTLDKYRGSLPSIFDYVVFSGTTIANN